MTPYADPGSALPRPWRVAALCLLLAVPVLAAAFNFDDVAAQAAALARQPYQAAPPADARMAALSYDDYRDIRFRPERSRWRDGGSLFQLQFFPLGRGTTRALPLFELHDGQVRPLEVPASDFQVGRVARGVQPLPGAAGWRLSYPLHRADRPDELIVFLGASYFRAIGAGQVYGLSARGLAVDTAGGQGEEFPAFTTFWFERPAPGAREMRFYALLDGPRVSGAYRFVVRPGTDTVLDVQARLYLRAPVAMLGIAPLTSMFLAGENQPVAHDYRPEVHDSDGLLIATGDGEQIWRPLSNPARPFVTSFATRSPRGFGLMQRDRAFTSYEDLEAHYQRRPRRWAIGGRAGSSCCSSARRTKPTTTSPPIGCPSNCRHRASLSTWLGAFTGRATICRPPGWRACSRHAVATASCRQRCRPGASSCM